jgi:regulator of protease activity HflC (stomatin/prohibitin superfamily)
VSLSTAARRAASHYTAEELYSTKRDEFAAKTKELLDDEIGKVIRDNYKGEDSARAGVDDLQVLVGHVGIPETVKHAIEAKLKADQEQQAMEFTILREKKEAERKRVEAEGIKSSKRS